MPSLKSIATTAVIAVLAIYVAKMVLPQDFASKL